LVARRTTLVARRSDTLTGWPARKAAYVVTFARRADKPDAMAVVDVDPESATYGEVVGFTVQPNPGHELHLDAQQDA